MRIYKACLVCIIGSLLCGAAIFGFVGDGARAETAPYVTPKQITLSVTTPTPTPSPVPTPSPTPVPFLGQWIYSFEGNDIVLTVEADGTGSILYKEESQSFSWNFSAGKLILTGIRTSFTCDVSSGSIVLQTADGTVTFVKKELA